MHSVLQQRPFQSFTYRVRRRQHYRLQGPELMHHRHHRRALKLPARIRRTIRC
jgi:hypothetical protein